MWLLRSPARSSSLGRRGIQIGAHPAPSHLPRDNPEKTRASRIMHPRAGAWGRAMISWYPASCQPYGCCGSGFAPADTVRDFEVHDEQDRAHLATYPEQQAPRKYTQGVIDERSQGSHTHEYERESAGTGRMAWATAHEWRGTVADASTPKRPTVTRSTHTRLHCWCSHRS